MPQLQSEKRPWCTKSGLWCRLKMNHHMALRHRSYRTRLVRWRWRASRGSSLCMVEQLLYWSLAMLVLQRMRHRHLLYCLHDTPGSERAPPPFRCSFHRRPQSSFGSWKGPLEMLEMRLRQSTYRRNLRWWWDTPHLLQRAQRPPYRCEAVRQVPWTTLWLRLSLC